METLATPSSAYTTTLHEKGVYPLKSAQHSTFCTINSRVESFVTWPPALKQQGFDLALAGFFYTNLNDTVVCFLCGLTLSKWMPEDVPITEHLKHTKQCSYALVHNLITYDQEDNTCIHTRCGVCNSAPKEFVLLPCRHFITCTLCTFSVQSCPLCRAGIDTIMHIYTN